MLSNRSFPNVPVVPELAYPDIGEAIDWLCDCFGFTVRIRMGNHRAQLNVGDGAVILIEAGKGIAARCSVMVRVEDVDAHHARSLAHGLKVLRTPETFSYGERQYNVEDHAGHRWCFTQSVADVDPADWGGSLG